MMLKKKINDFIKKLKISFPAQISIPYEAESSLHNNMYLCFLCGSEELMKIYVFGRYKDLMLDIDNWEFFSPYLLLIDEDFSRFIYINDNGNLIESISNQ